MGGRKVEMKGMVHQKIEYAKTSCGYVGVAPPIMMVSILREMKGGYISEIW
jgi:hypothetical protein